jgi:glycerol-3-phosphate O-acyltransferase
VLRKRYGKVAVNFGEPIRLDDVLDAADAGLARFAAAGRASRAGWINVRSMRRRRAHPAQHQPAADVNPVNLLALVPARDAQAGAMAETDLLSRSST